MNLLIVDDHPVLREGLASLLMHAGSDTRVLQAANAGQAMSLLEEQPDLDLIILDLAMPGMRGFEALAEFGRKRPELPVIVLSSSEDPQDVRKALACGALGYVPKSANQTVLLSAIRLVMDGNIYVPPLILEDAGHVAIDGGPSRAPTPLTARQIEVLALLSEGKPNKAIAVALALSEKTVKAHVTAIFKTLNVINRTQAAAAGRAAGLI